MRIIDLAATGRNIKRLRLEAGLNVRDLQEKRVNHFSCGMIITIKPWSPNVDAALDRT